jgi:hypothetical protein
MHFMFGGWFGVNTKCEWHLISKFSLPLAYCLQNPLANGKQGLVPEKMFKTLLIAFTGRIMSISIEIGGAP